MLAIIIYALTVVVPIGAWLLFLRWEDKSEPEPGRLVRRCFYIGILSALAAGVFEGIFFAIFHFLPDIGTDTTAPILLVGAAALCVGIIEELWKYLMLRASVYLAHDFNQIFDGILYGVTVALGFALVENITYAATLYYTLSPLDFVVSMVYRGLFAISLHVTATGITGYYLGKYKFTHGNPRYLIALGLLYSSLLHGVYDLLSSIPYGAIVGAFITVYYFIIFVKMWSDPKIRTVWKYVPAIQGQTEK